MGLSKLPVPFPYASNGKLALDPGFYYYCYYLKCHFQKKKFHLIPTLLGETEYKNK